MQTISLCMIVKNEEAVLERCLSGVKGIADEIIIVDTGSEDATEEIAAKFTDQIFHFPWQDDFAAARNLSFSKASCDFILWLDADDVLTEENRRKFLALKQTLTADTDMVMLPYHVAFNAQGEPVFTYYRERILRRAKQYRWVSAVHEVIVPSGNILYGDAAVEHRKCVVNDPDRNLRIFEKLISRGERLDARQKFYYARELQDHGRHEEALSAYKTFLADKNAWTENCIAACRYCAECLLALGREEEALSSLFDSFLYDSPRAEICCAIGNLLLSRQKYSEAVFWYETALRTPFPDENGGFHQPDCHDFIPLIQLCVCHDRMGNFRLAKTYNDRAGRIRPHDENVMRNQRYFQQKLERH